MCVEYLGGGQAAYMKMAPCRAAGVWSHLLTTAIQNSPRLPPGQCEGVCGRLVCICTGGLTDERWGSRSYRAFPAKPFVEAFKNLNGQFLPAQQTEQAKRKPPGTRYPLLSKIFVESAPSSPDACQSFGAGESEPDVSCQEGKTETSILTISAQQSLMDTHTAHCPLCLLMSMSSSRHSASA